MTSLAELVLEVHRSLDDARLPHAIGGAISLGFAIDHPRGTSDVDVNVLVSVSEAARVLTALPPGSRWDEDKLRRLERDGQVRVFCGEYPVNIFLSTNEFHDRAAENVRLVTFEGALIPILSADDLAVFKVFFNRRKDWVDVEAMVDAGSLHRPTLLATVSELLGADDARTQRLHELLFPPP